MDTCGAYCHPQPPIGVLPAHPLTPVQSAAPPAPVCPGANSPSYAAASPYVNPAAPLAPPAAGARPQAVLQAPPADSRLENSTWRPAPDAVTPAAPANPSPEPPAASPAAPRDSVRLYPPAKPEPPLAAPARPGVSEEPARPPAPAVSEQSITPSLPVGIPQFAAAVGEKVTSGLKPTLEGLDWLRANGYRTVLNIRAPAEDDAADRAQVEKRGLRYLSLAVSPEGLTRQVVDEFNRLVADRDGQPLFVYSKDGMLAGGLWYLHFRTADQESDEVARIKAARLGIKEDKDGDHKTMWLAIQKFLSEQAGKP
jgi:protein tyrosine phosphatase (PTP) superfamily phosphohydrolase (DUF442 family)